ncbi:MAG: redox-sensitive bicupin YhaK (pirin superfamily) [Cyclobacteriaceae bacterium]|jgi:redox-sensitive bicupin YhaK (pirin superfamily)
MKTVIHKSDSRGTASFGWLNSRHTFSFGHYHNPERMHFGSLRVLNDDIVEAGRGFGTHPHDNMEIVSIPFEGALEHKDSTGNTEVIKTGDVQIMSAGYGLTHSEYNHSKTAKVNFLQLWVFPKKKDIEPRYEQKTFFVADRKNQVQTVVAPDDKKAVWINQDSWFSLADIDAGKTVKYVFHKSSSGVYVFVLEGNVNVNGIDLSRRDGLGVSETDVLNIKAGSDTKILLVEVPML